MIVVAFGRKENIHALKGLDIWIYYWGYAPISLVSNLGFAAKVIAFIINMLVY